MLCTEVVLALAFIHAGVGLLDLLLDFLLHLFCLSLGHCRLELLSATVAAALFVVLAGSLLLSTLA